MKRLTGIVFIFMSFAVIGASESLIDYFNIFKDKEHVDLLNLEQKDKLLVIRKQYFKDLQILQEKSRELRKQANQYMIKNNEKEYEKIHDRMNNLKLEKKLLKEGYRKKIDEILKK